jgi:membrane dipeptidase
MASITQGPIRFDGMIVRVDPEPDLLDGSDLSAIVVTGADWHGDFAGTCEALGQWWRRFADEPDRWFPISTPADLARVGADPRIGVILALQNGALLEGHVDRLWTLHRLGVRVLQPTYNFATPIADGCLEDRDGGLTRHGRDVVRECNRLGIALDLSHVGDRSALDIAEASEAPVVVTHANRRSVAASPRNKEDDLLRAVAAGGGVVGVTAYGPACWRGTDHPPTFEDFAVQVGSMLDLVGEDAVAIGTDQYVAGPGGAAQAAQVLSRTASRYPEIVGEYVRRFGNTVESRYVEGFKSISEWGAVRARLQSSLGLEDRVLDKVLGENWVRVLERIASGAGQAA